MLGLVLLAFICFFAMELGAAGATLGLMFGYLSGSKIIRALATTLGILVGVGCGLYFGFDGFGGDAISGFRWYDGNLGYMFLLGAVLWLSAGALFALCYYLRLGRAERG